MSKAAASSPLTSFDGQVFLDADFKRAQFHNKTTFRNVQFHGRTNFSGAKFEGLVDFTGAQFLGDIDFSGATFTEPLRFDNMRFAGKTSFAGARFRHDAHFSDSEFAGDSDFSQATFHAWGLFNKSRFKAEVTFQGACFRGSAQFEDVDFTMDADFRKVRFIPFADFQRAQFHGLASFNNTSIECKTFFREARFSKAADFTECRFTHPVDFSRANFAAAAVFDRVVFLQFVDFREAHLADSFLLSPPKGSEGLAPEIRFELVTLDSPTKARFQNISFEKITLLGTNLRGIWFENPKWPRRGVFKLARRAVVYDEIQKEKPDSQKLVELYRDIRANLDRAGTKDDLRDLFYSEMEVRRKQPRSPKDRSYFLRRYFSPYTLFWLTCGYGRRPLRAVVIAGAIVLVYWLA
jgi:uncharacterized protein YjbI with pentapeptide repeats